MSTRTLLLSAGLLIACGAASSQPPTAPRPRFPADTCRRPHTPTFVPGAPMPGGPVVQPGVLPSVPAVPAPPPEKNVEQLIDELERLQAQKAELAKKEQELKATLHKKLEKQTERLNKLGVAPKDAKQPEPDRVGMIVVEGCPAKGREESARRDRPRPRSRSCNTPHSKRRAISWRRPGSAR